MPASSPFTAANRFRDRRFNTGYGLSVDKAMRVLKEKEPESPEEARSNNVKKAKKSGAFDTIRTAWNEKAVPFGQQMDEKGNIGKLAPQSGSETRPGKEKVYRRTPSGRYEPVGEQDAPEQVETNPKAPKAPKETPEQKAAKLQAKEHAAMLAAQEESVTKRKSIAIKSGADKFEDAYRSAKTYATSLRTKLLAAKKEFETLSKQTKELNDKGQPGPAGLDVASKRFKDLESMAHAAEERELKAMTGRDRYNSGARDLTQVNDEYEAGIKARKAMREAGEEVDEPHPLDGPAGGRAVEIGIDKKPLNPISLKGSTIMGERRRIAATIQDEGEQRAALADIEAREVDALTWEKAQLDALAGQSDEYLANQVTQWPVLIQASEQQLAQMQMEAQAKLQDYDARIAEVEQHNERMKGKSFNLAGTVLDPETGGRWTKALLDQRQFLREAQASHAEQSSEILAREAEEVERDRRVLNARITELNLRTEKARGAAKVKRESDLFNIENEGQEGVAADLRGLDTELDERSKRIQATHGPGPVRDAAMAALDTDRTKRLEAVTVKAQETADKGKELYDAWGSGLRYDWSDPDATSEVQERMDAEAAKRGLSPKAGRYWLTNYAQADWSKPSPVGGKEIDPGEQEFRMLPNGNITVNPAHLLDRQAYEKIVAESNAKPEAKAHALKVRDELAPELASNAIKALRLNSKMSDWLDDNTTGTDLDRMEQFTAKMKAGGAGTAAGYRFAAAVASIGESWTGAAHALTGDKTFMQADVPSMMSADFWSKRAEAFTTAASTAEKGTNIIGKYAAMVTGAIPSVLESIAAGSAAGALLKGGKLAKAGYDVARTGKTAVSITDKAVRAASMTGAALDAGIQSAGSTYVSALKAYEKEELSKLPEGATAIQQETAKNEARLRAIKPALLSGVATAGLTALGGAKGVEAVFRKGSQEAIKDATKKALRTRVAELGLDIGEEAIEEYSDQFVQGVIAQATFAPEKGIASIFEEAVDAGFVGGLMGGFMGSARQAAEIGSEKSLPENTAAITADIDGYVAPAGIDPEQVKADKAMAKVVVRVAQGEDVTKMTAADLEAIGWKMSADGTPTPTKDSAVYVRDGQTVIKDQVINDLVTKFPTIASMGLLTEEDRLAQIEEGATSQSSAKAGPVSAPSPEEWDRSNRHQQSNEWFEGGRANLEVNKAFERAATNGGADLATHGMAKVATLTGAIKALTDLLTNDLDQNRGRDADGARLHTAPLAVEKDSAAVHAGTTSGGTSYRDGPFILVNSAAASRADVGIRTMATVQAVLVNEANAGQLDAIRKAIHAIRPDIIVELYSKADQVAATLTGKAKASTTPTTSPVDQEAHKAATSKANDLPQPTEAQKKAGNYKMGHLNVGGLDITIENPDGSERSWTNDAGESGVSKINGHYGYIRNTTGADGDHIDALIKTGTPEDWNGTVFVIKQNKSDGKTFDEHKVYIGFESVDEAKRAYKSNYQKGWTGYGGAEPMSMSRLAEMVKSGKLKKSKSTPNDDTTKQADSSISDRATGQQDAGAGRRGSAQDQQVGGGQDQQPSIQGDVSSAGLRGDGNDQGSGQRQGGMDAQPAADDDQGVRVDQDAEGRDPRSRPDAGRRGMPDRQEDQGAGEPRDSHHSRHWTIETQSGQTLTLPASEATTTEEAISKLSAKAKLRDMVKLDTLTEPGEAEFDVEVEAAQHRATFETPPHVVINAIGPLGAVMAPIRKVADQWAKTHAKGPKAGYAQDIADMLINVTARYIGNGNFTGVLLSDITYDEVDKYNAGAGMAIVMRPGGIYLSITPHLFLETALRHAIATNNDAHGADIVWLTPLHEYFHRAVRSAISNSEAAAIWNGLNKKVQADFAKAYNYDETGKVGELQQAAYLGHEFLRARLEMVFMGKTSEEVFGKVLENDPVRQAITKIIKRLAAIFANATRMFKNKALAADFQQQFDRIVAAARGQMPPEIMAALEDMAHAEGRTISVGDVDTRQNAREGKASAPPIGTSQQVRNFINANFGAMAAKVKIDLVYNVSGPSAHYVISESNKKHGGYIEYNPIRLMGRSQGQIMETMREEMIHGLLDQALLKRVMKERGITKTDSYIASGQYHIDFYQGVFDLMTPQEKAWVKKVYTSHDDVEYVIGAEFSRMALQRQFYGGLTEQAHIGHKKPAQRSKALEAIRRLLQEIVDFMDRLRSDTSVAATQIKAVYNEALKALTAIDQRQAMVQGANAPHQVYVQRGEFPGRGSVLVRVVDERTNTNAWQKSGPAQDIEGLTKLAHTQAERLNKQSGSTQAANKPVDPQLSLTYLAGDETSRSKSNPLDPAHSILGDDAVEGSRGLLSTKTLLPWARQKGWEIDVDALAATFGQEVPGGDEHDVWYDEKTDRAIKVTIDDQWLQGNPAAYLTNLRRQNELFGTGYAFEGVADDSGKPRIVTSQPWVHGEPLSDQVKIDIYMMDKGFERISDGLYFNEKTEVMVGDVLPRNVILGDDGQVQAIDVQVKDANPRQVQKFTDIIALRDKGLFANAPLVGLPSPVEVPGRGKVAFGPFETARRTAEGYMKQAGLEYDPPRTYAKVDKERAGRIAAAFDAMKHEPQDPKVKASYQAMINETLAQWEAIKATGLKVEPIPAGMPDPYDASPRLAQLDAVENNHLWFFPTDNGFGNDVTGFDPKDNPLFEFTGEQINGHKMRANDVFRIVHDYFGHFKEGVGFRADGEENAWRQHSAMYSQLARGAMTTETRGQNSWLNFGPYGEKNRTAKTGDTVFADQKIGLMPEWTWYDGAGDQKQTSRLGDEAAGSTFPGEPAEGSIPAVESGGSIDKNSAQSTVIQGANTPSLSPVLYRGHTKGAVSSSEKDLTNPGNIIFSSNKEVARHYARTRHNGVVTEAVLKYLNPLVINADGNAYSEVPVPTEMADQFVRDTAQIDYLARAAKAAGYDALIVKDVMDQWGDGDQYVVFDESQVATPQAANTPELDLGRKGDPALLRQKNVKRLIEKQAAAHPEALPVEYIKDGKLFRLDEKGLPIASPQEYDLINSGLSKESARGLRGDARRNAYVMSLADKLEGFFNKIKNQPEVMAGKEWYRVARQKLTKVFGEDTMIFSQFLAATSARTPVKQNFEQALDAYNQMRQGQFNGITERYLSALKTMEAGELQFRQSINGHQMGEIVTPKTMRDWLDVEGILPRRTNGKKYNANSMQVLNVVAGVWREKLGGPKTAQFSDNLSGASNEATIDVWAARTLHRMSNEGYAAKWRILPEAETGVTQDDFDVGQDAFRVAALRLGMKPDDLQGILWFAEKRHWAEKGWTRAAGAELSDFSSLLDFVTNNDGKLVLRIDDGQATFGFDEQSLTAPRSGDSRLQARQPRIAGADRGRGNAAGPGRQSDASTRPGRGSDRVAAQEERALFANSPGNLLAPNGKPTNLSPKQWNTVRTPAFKKWFGDWEKFANGKDGNGVWSDASGEVSKIVDENGEPMVMYHGSREAGFGSFDMSKAPSNRPNSAFFSNNRRVARTYSGSGSDAEIGTILPDDFAEGAEIDRKWSSRLVYVKFSDGTEQAVDHGLSDEETIAKAAQYAQDEALSQFNKHRGIYAVFLNLRNPHESDFEGANWDGSREGQYSVYDGDLEDIVYDENGKGYFDYESDAKELAAKHPGAIVRSPDDHQESTNAVAFEAAKYKNDGAIVRNVRDLGDEFDTFEASDVVIVFDPENIKDANNNNGEFSASDVRILFANAPKIPHPSTWMPRTALRTDDKGVIEGRQGQPHHELEDKFVRMVLGDGMPKSLLTDKFIQEWKLGKNEAGVPNIIAWEDVGRIRRGFIGKNGFVDRDQAFKELPQIVQNAIQNTFAMDELDTAFMRPEVWSNTGVSIQFANTPQFYSKLSRVIESKMPARAPTGVVEAIIKNPANGIKAEEIKWSGILPWLNRQPATVAKADVMAHLEGEGRVQFNEVRLGGRSHQDPDELMDIIEREMADYEQFKERESMLREYVDRWMAGRMNDREFREKTGVSVDTFPGAKFAAHTLPGGTNYREVLLTMPAQPMSLEEYSKAYKKAVPGIDDTTISERYPSYLQDPGEDLSRSNYRSSHFPDVPNYVAHMRLDDREDANGWEGTLIEELQSDRHQQGREEGYKATDPEALFSSIQDKYLPIAEGATISGPDKVGIWKATINEGTSDHFAAFGKTGDDARQNLLRHLATRDPSFAEVRAKPISGPDNRIPDAPFRQSRDWGLHLFKRALADAVAAGKVWIGWTTGATQNDRYDLSKQVSRITVESAVRVAGPKEGYRFTAFKEVAPAITRERAYNEMRESYERNVGQLSSQAEQAFNGWLAGKVSDEDVAEITTTDPTDFMRPAREDQVISKLAQNEAELADNIGKELASKAVAYLAKTEDPSKQRYEFEAKGDDLRIGGRGMIEFYDKIMVNEIGKYVKQWDGKVGNTTINKIDERDADGRLNQLPFGMEREGTTIWRVDITPQMMTGVASGQALFANAPGLDSDPIINARSVPYRGVKEGHILRPYIDNMNNRARAGAILRSFKKDWSPFFVYTDELASPADRKQALSKIIDRFALSDTPESIGLWNAYAALDPSELLPEDSDMVKEARELLPHIEEMSILAMAAPDFPSKMLNRLANRLPSDQELSDLSSDLLEKNPNASDVDREMAVAEAVRNKDKKPQTTKQWEEKARQMIADNRDGIIEQVLSDFFDGSGIDNPELMVAARLLKPILMEEAVASGDPEQVRQAQAFVYAAGAGLSETARALRASATPLDDHRSRVLELLSNLTTAVPASLRHKILIAPTPGAKRKKISDLEKRVKQLEARLRVKPDKDTARQRTQAKKDLEESRAEKDRQQLTEAYVAARRSKVLDTLKHEGLSEDDIFITAESRLNAQESEVVAEAMAKHPEAQHDAIRYLMRGYSHAQVSSMTGLPLSGVAALHERFRSQSLKQSVARWAGKGRSIMDMIRDGVKRVFGGGEQQAKAPVAWTQAKGSVAANLSAEIDRQLAILCPTATQVNNGSLKANVVKVRQVAGYSGPAQQKVTIHTKFSPDDFKSIYALARSISISEATGFDKLYEYWINNLLSGPTTNFVNIIGNTLSTAIHFLPQRFFESLWNLFGIGGENSASFGEFGEILKGMIPGLQKAWANAWMAFSSESDPVAHQYMNEPMSLEFDTSGDIAKIGGYRGPSIGGTKGRIVRIPGRVLKAMDAGFKTFIMHAEVGAQAYRLGKIAQRHGAIANGSAALEGFIASQINTPGSMSWNASMRVASELVFQDSNWLTDIAKQVTQIPQQRIDARKKKSAELEAAGDFEGAAKMRFATAMLIFTAKLMSVIFPFVKTPANILRMGIRKSPLGAINLAANILWMIGNGAYRKVNGKPAFTSAGRAQLVKLLSEQTQAFIMLGFLLGAAEGDDDDDQKRLLIVGGRSWKNKDESDEVNRKYGGQYMIVIRDAQGREFRQPFGKFEPIATILGTTIDSVRRLKMMFKAKSLNEAGGSYEEVINAIVGDLANQAEDKSFLQGFSSLMREYEMLKTSGGIQAGAGESLAKSLLTLIVPNIIRQPLRNIDEKLRDSKKKSVWHDAWPSGDFAEPVIDILGNDVEKDQLFPGSRILIPAATKQQPSHPIEKLITAWNNANMNDRIEPTNLGRKDYYVYGVDGKSKMALITPKERVEFERRVGREFKAAIDIISSNVKADALPEKFNDIIRNARAEAKRKVRAEFFPSPFRAAKELQQTNAK